MADITKNVLVNVKAEDNTEKAFKSAAKNAENFGGQVNVLNNTLKKLGKLAIEYFALNKISGFIASSTEIAMDKAKILSLVSAQIKKSGVDYEDASSKISKFSESMEKLGIDGEVASASVGKLLLKTKDVGRAMELSKLASDLASSGIGDYTSNTDLLQKILIGKGQRALLQFGIAMSDNSTIAEQLDAVTKRVTRTTEQWSETSEGTVKKASVQWENFKEDIGAIGAVTLVNLSNAFTNAYNSIGGQTETFGKFLAEFFNIGIPSLGNNVAIMWQKVVQAIAYNMVKIVELQEKMPALFPTAKGRKEFFQNAIEGTQIEIDRLKKSNIDLVNNFESSWNDLKGISKLGAVDVGNEYEYVGDEAQKLADEIKSNFIDMSRKIVSSFNEQEKAIKNLRNELENLDKDTEEQLNKADQRYQEDLRNRAKQSKERIEQIEKEIAETRNARSQGWRTEIAELEAEKLKEQNILKRIGGEVSNLNEDLAKDELTILKEKLEAEKALITQEAERARIEKESEISQRTGVQLRGAVASLSPEVMSGLITENQSFLGQIGAGPNQYIFTFNGDINDENKLITIITNALNRQATLRGVAGK